MIQWIWLLLAICWCIFGIFSSGDWYNYETGRQDWPSAAAAVMIYPLVFATVALVVYHVFIRYIDYLV